MRACVAPWRRGVAARKLAIIGAGSAEGSGRALRSEGVEVGGGGRRGFAAANSGQFRFVRFPASGESPWTIRSSSRLKRAGLVSSDYPAGMDQLPINNSARKIVCCKYPIPRDAAEMLALSERLFVPRN